MQNSSDLAHFEMKIHFFTFFIFYFKKIPGLTSKAYSQTQFQPVPYSNRRLKELHFFHAWT